MKSQSNTQQQEEAADPLDPTLAGSMRAWWANMRGLGRDYLLLAVLEMQRAGIGLAMMLAACVVIAVLVVTAWMALVAGLVVWAVNAGTASWPVALCIAAAVNVILAVVMAMQLRSQLTQIFLGATLRQLRGEGRGH
ncbi:MAG TPA: phage holin family protein [Burkholderiales bacterium]